MNPSEQLVLFPSNHSRLGRPLSTPPFLPPQTGTTRMLFTPHWLLNPVASHLLSQQAKHRSLLYGLCLPHMAVRPLDSCSENVSLEKRIRLQSNEENQAEDTKRASSHDSSLDAPTCASARMKLNRSLSDFLQSDESAGLSLRQIGKKFGVHQQHVRRVRDGIFNENGARGRPPVLSAKEDQVLYERCVDKVRSGSMLTGSLFVSLAQQVWKESNPDRSSCHVPKFGAEWRASFNRRHPDIRIPCGKGTAKKRPISCQAHLLV